MMAHEFFNAPATLLSGLLRLLRGRNQSLLSPLLAFAAAHFVNPPEIIATRKRPGYNRHHFAKRSPVNLTGCAGT